MLKKLKEFFRGQTEEERMYAFLSQATDRVHLEHLEREWFQLRRKSSNVALYR